MGKRFDKFVEELHEFERKNGIKPQLSTQEAIVEPLLIFSAFAFGPKILEKLLKD
jgi:hypothetical protein